MSAIPASPRQAGHHITSPTSPRSIGSLVSLIPVGLSTSAPSGPTLTASVERARTTQAAPGQYAANKSHSVPRAQVARTKSAPTSPAGRVHPAGLTPLSKIAPIHLESAPIPHAESSRDGALAASLHQGGSAGGAAVVGGDGQVYQRHVSQPLPLQRPAQQHRVRATTTALPPLLNPAARIRVGARPGKFNGSSASSASGSETEGFDSDSTFVPGRAAMRPKQSLSQPDLTALRSRLEGWAGGVAKENAAAEERKAREARRRTPPSRPVPLNTVSAPVGELRSKSQTSLSGMRKSPSPRMSPALISPMTPVLSSSSDGSSPRFGRSFSGGLGGSEDADDDWDGTTDSPSSGSLTFSPKHRTRQRQTLERERDRTRGGLGLSFGPDTPPTPKEEPLPVMIERRLQKSDLFFLRALAVIPSIWGMAVMLLAFVSGELYMESWPWGVDWSREALERLVAGGPALEGPIRKVARGDMVLAMAWAMCTAHFCFKLTTGLAHRWRSYYSLPSTLTRLLSLQCLCWPATYLTLRFLGAERPLLAWIVIGVTTGWSRTVQMWVTSNVIVAGSGGAVDTTPKAKSPPLPPAGAGWWEGFTFGRKWDWSDIAREVGWKVGSLLLITCAWMFWKVETGQLVEVVDGRWR